MVIKIRRLLLVGFLTLGILQHALHVSAQVVEVEKKVEKNGSYSKEIEEKKKIEEKKSPSTVTMSLNADTFFGFYPIINGTYQLREDFAIYWNLIYWTMTSGVGSGNNNPWLQTDVGVNLLYFDKHLSVTPAFGFTHGMYMSSRGGFFPSTGEPAGGPGGEGVNQRGSVFEGYQPSLLTNWLSEKFEGEAYVAYYAALREEGGHPSASNPPGTPGARGSWDFLYWWANYGYRINEKFSVGGHYEEFLSVRDNSAPNAQMTFYSWVGPYFEVKLFDGILLRLTGGKDLVQDQDFYKLKFSKTF